MKLKKIYVICLKKNNKLEYLKMHDYKTFNMYTYVLDRDCVPYTKYEEVYYEEY